MFTSLATILASYCQARDKSYLLELDIFRCISSLALVVEEPLECISSPALVVEEPLEDVPVLPKISAVPETIKQVMAILIRIPS
jgi:hypothetical protein